VAEHISLIVGLGNPGPEHAETRHNAGFRFLEAIAVDVGGEFRRERKFTAQVADGQVDGRRVRLLAPQTYMNLSGDAVTGFAHYYKIPVENILVVHDDLDLPPGTVRLKRGGGAGGHNGLVDVIVKLGSPDFLRLRIGIGHPGSSRQAVSYVLKKAPAAEQDLIDAAIQSARERLKDIVAGRYEAVMNVLHTTK